MPLYPKGHRPTPTVLPSKRTAPETADSALLAASEDGVLAFTALDGLEEAHRVHRTFLYPIQLSARGNLNSVSGDVIVMGLSETGEVMSERMHVSGASPTVGSKRFQTVLQVVLPRKSPAGGDEQIAVGNAPPLLP